MAKIAIYHGFLEMHFEMLGYIYDYAQSFPEHEYFFFSNAYLDYKAYYDNFFGNRLWYDPRGIDIKNFDRVFLLTDTDPSLKQYEYYPEKVISIQHGKRNRNPFNKPRHRIYTRPHSNNNTNWAIPCYNIPIIKNIPNKIHILMVGEAIGSTTAQTLYNLFYPMWNDVVFHIVKRKISSDWIEASKQYNNIMLHENCLSFELLEILSKCSYILAMQEKENYIDNAMSGSIPLAFITHTKLIMPKKALDVYKFSTSIAIEDINTKTLAPLSEKDVLEIREEKDKLIAKRNEQFSFAINN